MSEVWNRALDLYIAEGMTKRLALALGLWSMGIQYLPVTFLCGLAFPGYDFPGKHLKDDVSYFESQKIFVFEAHGIGQSGCLEAVPLTS